MINIIQYTYVCIRYFVVVQSLSHVQFFETSWTAARQASLSFTISRSLLKLMSIESVMSSNYLILCCPLLLLHSIFPPSGYFQMSQLFASGGQSIEASPSVLPVNIQGWLLQDWLKVNWLWLVWSPCSQTTLKSRLIPHHSSKASVLWCSAFFMVQLSHLYMTTRKTIALMIWTFVGKSDVSAF